MKLYEMKYCSLTWNPKTGKKEYSDKGNNTGYYETGAGLTVIDIDSLTLPKDLKAILGKLKPTTKTKRGSHYYFEHDAKINYRSKTHLGKENNIDIRGEGGKIFATYKGDSEHISYQHNSKNIYKLDDYPMVKHYLDGNAIKKHTPKSIEHDDDTIGDMSIEEVKTLLDKVDVKDYSKRDPWMGMLASIYKCGGGKIEDVAREWSKGDVENYEDDAFDHIWSQCVNGKYGEDYSKGTLIRAAHGEKLDGVSVFVKEQGSVFNLSKKEKKKILKKKKKKKKIKLSHINYDDSYLEYNPDDFPENIRQYMFDVAKHHNLNFSSLVTYAMMTASNMIGNKVVLDVFNNGTWIHTPIIWGMNIAASGIGKTPAMSKLSAPNRMATKTVHNRYAKKLEEYQKELHKYNAAKDDEKAEMKIPIAPKEELVTVDVITPEALYQVLDASENGTMLWKDELADLFRSSERNENTRTTLLQAWSGAPVSYVTKSSGIYHIEAPYMRVGGNIQPEVAKRIIHDHKSGDKADGLFPRFGLISHLKSTGYAVCKDAPNIFAETAYIDAMMDLFKMYRGARIESSTKRLRMTPKAQLLMDAWIEDNRKKIDKDATDEHERGYLSKAGSLLSSLIVILHELSGGALKVKPSTVTKAVSITEKAIENAFHLYDLERREEVVSNIAEEALEEWLKKTDTFQKHNNELTLTNIWKNYLNRKVTAVQAKAFFNNRDSYEVIQCGRGYKVIKL